MRTADEAMHDTTATFRIVRSENICAMAVRMDLRAQVKPSTHHPGSCGKESESDDDECGPARLADDTYTLCVGEAVLYGRSLGNIDEEEGGLA